MAEEAPEESVPVMDHPMQLFKPADVSFIYDSFIFLSFFSLFHKQALIGLRGCKIDQVAVFNRNENQKNEETN